MHRAILFRYHKRPDICRNRIALLRRLNPGMAIYGMYGGSLLSPPVLPLNHNYKLPFASARYKWQHGDLCARQWFIDCGHRFSFDMLHIVEWDMVYLQPINILFRGIRDGVSETNIKSIHAWRALNWYWIYTPEGDARLQTLRAYVRKKHGRTFEDANQLAAFFPGASLSRAFLERYAEDDPPALLNDEIRTPLFAQAYGMKVHDTQLHMNNPYADCYKRRFPKSASIEAFSKYKMLHHMTAKIDIPPKYPD